MTTVQLPPTQKHLERLYYELSLLGAPSVGKKSRWPYHPKNTEELLVLAGEMLRYDARLLSILLQFVVQHEASINPRALREHMQRMRWPQALLVLFEFARESAPDSEVRYMADYLGFGFERLRPAEQFFMDGDRPASRRAQSRLGRNLSAYAKWGFIGNERPTIDAHRKTTVGKYDASTRRDIALGLVDRHGAISLARYLQAIDGSISRAQARTDLRAAGLKLRGRGRGAVWAKS